MLYPLIFEPIYKEVVWGGNRLQTILGRDIPIEHTGESWDITCRPKEMGIVANGKYRGKKFNELINLDRESYLGTSIQNCETFPLLVKLIDANSNLSVQVHPTDDYAKACESYDYGKTEMWYVLEAPEDACIILGLKDGVTRESFSEAIEQGSVESSLERLPVRRGDVVYIASGLVHALTEGVLVAEIQQNSDITYRVYDYNRLGLDGKPRPLHIEKALEVIDFNGVCRKNVIRGLEIKAESCAKRFYISDKNFCIIKYDIEDSYTEHSDPRMFYIFTCVDGYCEFHVNDYCMDICPGESVFVPAMLGEYIFKGKCTLLKSFIPTNLNEFSNELLNAGYSQEEITSSTVC